MILQIFSPASCSLLLSAAFIIVVFPWFPAAEILRAGVGFSRAVSSVKTLLVGLNPGVAPHKARMKTTESMATVLYSMTL